MRWNFQNYRDFILQTSTLLEQKFTNLYKLKPRGMNSRGPIENLICKMYDFIELWGLWHPIGILNGVFKITNLLKSRVPSVNISSKASSLGEKYGNQQIPAKPRKVPIKYGVRFSGFSKSTPFSGKVMPKY